MEDKKECASNLKNSVYLLGGGDGARKQHVQKPKLLGVDSYR